MQVSTTTFPGTSKLDLHEEVKKSLIKAGATSNQVNQIQSALEKAQAAHHGSGFNQRAWWTIVKNATGWNETQLNNWVHSFMKDTLRELNENGKSEIKNALLSTRLATMNVNDPWTTFADTYLSSPKIGLIKPGEGDQILQNLQAFLKGKNIATFSAQERMNMGYYAHLAIHNDIGIGSRLMKELTVNVTTPDQVIDEIHKITNHYRFDGIGMPVYANTYRKHLDPNDNERGTLLPNSAPSSIPTPQ